MSCMFAYVYTIFLCFFFCFIIYRILLKNIMHVVYDD